jgi:hypothetical protein
MYNTRTVLVLYVVPTVLLYRTASIYITVFVILSNYRRHTMGTGKRMGKKKAHCKLKVIKFFYLYNYLN